MSWRASFPPFIRTGVQSHMSKIRLVYTVKGYTRSELFDDMSSAASQAVHLEKSGATGFAVEGDDGSRLDQGAWKTCLEYERRMG